MPYEELRADVISMQQDSDTITTCLRINGEPVWQIVPAALYDLTDASREILQLHCLVKEEKELLTFETYGYDQMPQLIGLKFIFRSWWVPEAFDAVADLDAEWKLSEYPNNGDHDHCLLTWETIASYSENKLAYHSKYGWITVKAFTEFIENDRLRIRLKKNQLNKHAG